MSILLFLANCFCNKINQDKMNIKYLTIFIALLHITLGWSQTQSCLQNLDHPDNRVLSQTIGQDLIQREYILKIPTDYDHEDATPLLINLHGFGDCASDYSELIGEFYGLAKLANERNFIVAYPQGAYRPEKDDTYWEPGDSGIENIYDNDVYFIENLIAELSEEYNINPAMIYACGYSNGGMMAYSLACNRSNLFAAIGIMSGTMLEEDCTLEKPVPVIKFHGIADEVLPYNGNVWYQSVDEIVNFWLDKNEIPVSSLLSHDLNDGKVISDSYFGFNNNCLRLYTINEEYGKPGDHVWFSEKIEAYTPNERMWFFFTSNCELIISIDENEQESFTVYPNPVDDELIIENAFELQFFIYSVQGKLLKSGVVDSNFKRIDFTTSRAGIYTVKVGQLVKKIIKL